MLVRGRGAALLTMMALALAGCGLVGGGGDTGHRETGGDACFGRLAARHVAFTPAPFHAASAACTVDNPVRVSEAAMRWNPPAVLACGFAARFDDFLVATAEPLARSDLGASIMAMRQMGAYSCRRVAGGTHMSEHASGQAIDVAGFSLSNGEFVSVEHDWRGGGRKTAFLHDFARAACGAFGVVLTPDANRYHFNHIHIDASRYHLCGVRQADGALPPELHRSNAETE